MSASTAGMSSGGGRTGAEAAPADAPNVVVIVLDDVGFADLGPYGSEIATPAIDRLAAGGLTYTEFHTTAMCSPTRASLLTGRMPHAVGMGIIAEWATDAPGYRGRVSRRAATLAEMLRPHGYSTLAVGKWHLMPMDDATDAGPFDDWPLGRGFDRWCGFHGALADSWHPELFEDNHTIEPPARPDYHLSEDLVDRAIGMIRDQHVAAPARPFFLYLAFGACHWPHQAPRAMIDRYRGCYDAGWDTTRQQRLDRQRALGIVPPDTALAPRNPGVQAWDDLSADERRLCARQQEVYAAFVEHTDAQIGRLVDALAALGQLDNTLLLLLSDNGASPEGGAHGAVNARKHLVTEPEPLTRTLAGLDRLGSDRAYGHYPAGWAQASNTPLKWYKKDVHGGGIRDPLIIHWPRRIVGDQLRRQYHHVADLAPTVLEALGLTTPATVDGVPQLPLHGVSLAYTFAAGDAPTRKQTQYYELLGDRALWHDGWKAVARHEPGVAFAADRWELYHVADDYAECRDLAAEQPDRLRDLIERWWAEAGRYDVLPLDDREYERVAANIAARRRRETVLLPGTARLDRYHVPDITDRSFQIAAMVDLPAHGAAGVLLAIGTRFGGLALFVQDGRLTYEYVYDDDDRTRLVANRPLPVGPATLALAFRRTGRRRGEATLLIDDQPAGTITIPKTWPVAGLAGGLRCGRDGGAPVSDAYPLPFTFTGTLHRVIVTLGEDGAPDTAATGRAALAEQ